MSSRWSAFASHASETIPRSRVMNMTVLSWCGSVGNPKSPTNPLHARPSLLEARTHQGNAPCQSYVLSQKPSDRSLVLRKSRDSPKTTFFDGTTLKLQALLHTLHTQLAGLPGTASSAFCWSQWKQRRLGTSPLARLSISWHWKAVL